MECNNESVSHSEKMHGNVMQNLINPKMDVNYEDYSLPRCDVM